MANKIQKDTADKVSTNIRVEGTESSKFHVQTRSFAVPVQTTEKTVSDTSTKEEPKPPATLPLKRKIMPLHQSEILASADGSSQQKYMDTKPPAKKESPASETTDKTDTPAAPAEKEKSAVVTSSAEPGPQLPIHTKESEEAEANKAKRNQDLENIIDSRKYFVPINTVAIRRSIKVSITLTIVVFLLSIILLDFLLDTGTILLLQKIPHTHFFSINNSNNQQY